MRSHLKNEQARIENLEKRLHKLEITNLLYTEIPEKKVKEFKEATKSGCDANQCDIGLNQRHETLTKHLLNTKIVNRTNLNYRTTQTKMELLPSTKDKGKRKLKFSQRSKSQTTLAHRKKLSSLVQALTLDEYKQRSLRDRISPESTVEMQSEASTARPATDIRELKRRNSVSSISSCIRVRNRFDLLNSEFPVLQ